MLQDLKLFLNKTTLHVLHCVQWVIILVWFNNEFHPQYLKPEFMLEIKRKSFWFPHLLHMDKEEHERIKEFLSTSFKVLNHFVRDKSPKPCDILFSRFYFYYSKLKVWFWIEILVYCSAWSKIVVYKVWALHDGFVILYDFHKLRTTIWTLFRKLTFLIL